MDYHGTFVVELNFGLLQKAAFSNWKLWIWLWKLYANILLFLKKQFYLLKVADWTKNSSNWVINCSWSKFIAIIVNVSVSFMQHFSLDSFDFSSDF